MSMPLSAATPMQTELSGTGTNGFSRVQTQREQLASGLRNLVAELDGLDRRLSDLDWQCHRRQSGAIATETSGERTALETRRAELTSQLGVLARDLYDLDMTLASYKGRVTAHPPRVGTCPDCGYPSLESGLCAFCRPRLAH